MNIIVITGQTATGKTNLAIKLAKQHHGELINADSRQIYKGIDIITGKDLPVLDQSGLPIHLFDLISPKETFSSYDFVQRALPIIKAIVGERNKIPIIVGGTYLYLKHLLYGFSVQVQPDWQLRTKLARKTVPQLQNIVLRSMNETKQQNTMNNSDWHNPRRLIRKIEIFQSHSKPISLESKKTNGILKSYSVKVIGLMHADREHMKQAIRTRVEKRLEEGVIEEARKLSKQYPADSPGFNSIGFPQLLSFIKDRITLAELIEEWTTKEIQYAQRQYTFMKKDMLIDWRLLD